MKKKFHIVSFLLKPYVISFFICLTIIASLPNHFSKYQLISKKDFSLNTPGNKIFYEDIDGDGLSEKVETMANKLGNASYMLFNSNGDFIDQFNMSTKFGNANQVWFQDANLNGIKEIYLLTRSRDSIFLNINEHTAENWVNKNIFVDKIAPFNGVFEFGHYAGNELEGIFFDGSYFYFSISVGYGGSPRNIYAYDSAKSTILKSPHLTNPPTISQIVDFDNDGKNEVLVANWAAGNTIDSSYTTRSDYSTWLNILEDDLQHLFDPIEFSSYGAIHPKVIEIENQKMILSLFSSFNEDKSSSKLMVTTLKGEIVSEIELPKGRYINLTVTDKNEFAFYDWSNQSILVYNNNLSKIEEHSIGISSNKNYFYDLNKDGTREWIFLDNVKNILTVFQSDFSDRVDVQIPKAGNSIKDIGVRYIQDNGVQIKVQMDNALFLYSYEDNPYFQYRYFVYLLIYLLVLSLAFLIAKGQQIQEQRRRNLEQQISDLQLKTIKNKVDPHFVFNALNTISEMTLTDNKWEADKFITNYARFMRVTLEHSDKIATTLTEELEYTKTFIELQRIRFQQSFEYNISVDKKVNKEMKVPKHILFTYVENAIKYGLANHPNGRLNIKVRKNKNSLEIIISDNGLGFKNGVISSVSGTGNGLKIMGKIFKLFEDRFNMTITEKITEKKESGRIKGVDVLLVLTIK